MYYLFIFSGEYHTDNVSSFDFEVQISNTPTFMLRVIYLDGKAFSVMKTALNMLDVKGNCLS